MDLSSFLDKEEIRHQRIAMYRRQQILNYYNYNNEQETISSEFSGDNNEQETISSEFKERKVSFSGDNKVILIPKFRYTAYEIERDHNSMYLAARDVAEEYIKSLK